MYVYHYIYIYMLFTAPGLSDSPTSAVRGHHATCFYYY